jgi:hypothetical protein
MINPPLTLDQFITELCRLRDTYPDYASRPVHVLDMEDDKGGDSLVTHVELDCLDDQQGPVTSVMSWPSCDK